MSETKKIIDETFAKHFVEEWLAAWNAHDIEKILSHYTDDFSIETPLALQRMPETKGVLQGKENIRAYWASALKANPNLHFRLINICYGINSLAIYYESISMQKQVVENVFFNEEMKVKKVIVMYSA